MNEYTITALPRDAKATPKALRRAGFIPCVMYGRESAPESIQVQTALLSRLVSRAGSSLVDITVEGIDAPISALIREVQRDPVTRRLVHVDFLTVQANQLIRNVVPIVQKGTAPIEQRGGVIIQMLDRLEIECLPAHMPHAIAIDISSLNAFNAHLSVADLVIPQNVTVLSNPEAEVVHVMAPMREEVEAAAPVAEAGAEVGAVTATTGEAKTETKE